MVADPIPFPDDEVRSHRECMRNLSDLESCVAQAGAGSDWLEHLQTCMDHFSTSLRSHFAGEERGRLYQELPVKFPRLSGKAEGLRAEHDVILRDVDSVSKNIRAGGDAGKLRDCALKLIDTVHRHEQRESQLLQSAYWREVGAGD